MTAVGQRVLKHEQIAEDLRRRIRSGELADGDRLPGENALTATYGGARMTARQALLAVQNEGLAVARAGLGIYVRSFRPVRRLAAARPEQEVWGSGRPRWDVEPNQLPVVVDGLTVDEVAAPKIVAGLLDIPVGTPVIRWYRRYLVNGEPIQVATSSVPAALASGAPIVPADAGPGSVLARLADRGHAAVRFSEELRARMPTREEAEVLHLAAGTPVISMVRTSFTADGRPVEASECTLSSAAYVLQYDVRI